MINWTTETIIALAPDTSSASSGRSLSNRKSWLGVARHEHVIWGECQGSGKHPYQTRIDMNEPAFKCTCPSRKFPCKHGLGLFLLFAAKPDEFQEQPAPSWVQEWLDGRTARAKQKAEQQGAEQGAETAKKPTDPKAQEKRLAARDKKVRAGLEELSLWSRDLVRTGVSGALSKGYGYWETMAARLVDAQAPGLARLVREIPGLLVQEHWQTKLLERLGTLHLSRKAYLGLEHLPQTVQADVRTAIGLSTPSEDVLAEPGVRDTWHVLGQSLERDDRLRSRRIWLYGQNTKQTALLLDFAAAQSPLAPGPPVGSSVVAELAFYPSGYPQRALIKHEFSSSDITAQNTDVQDMTALTDSGIEGNLLSYAQARASNPWLERVLFRLANSSLQLNGTVMDEHGHTLPVHPKFARLWEWLAVTGGMHGTIFGEWNGAYFMPFSVFVAGAFHNFAFDEVADD